MGVPLFVKVVPLQLLLVLMLVEPWLLTELSIRRATQHGLQAQQAISMHKAVVVNKNIEDTPVRIIIPYLGIDLPITAQVFDKTASKWPVSSNTANYASESSLVNNTRGKAFIYGHWSNKIFGSTNRLVPGDVAFIYTANGHVFKYTYRDYNVINPNNAAIIYDAKSNPGIKIMTCQGLLAQQRRIMNFDLESAV